MMSYYRLPFLFLAMASLLLGLLTGLHRIGWDISMFSATPHHGAIMVGGFLGTLISLEKIIPLRKKLLFLIPMVSAGSVVLFVLDHPRPGFVLLLVASTGLSAVFLHYFLKQRNTSYLLMLVGAICWLTGNALLLSKVFYPMAFPWWLAFALCIISSERLDLMKFLPVKEGTKKLLILFIGVYIVGMLVSFHGIGQKLCGLSLIAVALWLMRYDIISVSIRKDGLARFAALALLTGYIAMLMAGIFVLSFSDQPMSYDAIVHTFFIGFVFSMIFAHGPIILPGVLGISVKPYHPALYLWLVFLHLSWITRLVADVIVNFELRKISALLTALSILCYFATIATVTIVSQRRHAKVL